MPPEIILYVKSLRGSVDHRFGKEEDNLARWFLPPSEELGRGRDGDLLKTIGLSFKLMHIYTNMCPKMPKNNSLILKMVGLR